MQVMSRGVRDFFFDFEFPPMIVEEHASQPGSAALPRKGAMATRTFSWRIRAARKGSQLDAVISRAGLGDDFFSCRFADFGDGPLRGFVEP